MQFDKLSLVCIDEYNYYCLNVSFKAMPHDSDIVDDLFVEDGLQRSKDSVLCTKSLHNRCRVA